MKASDIEETKHPAPLASSKEWWQLTGCAFVIVLLCVVWTFWA